MCRDPPHALNSVLLEIEVEPFDPRVLIDTTRSVWPFNKPREELVMLVEGVYDFKIVGLCEKA